jgi:hypothetical protein
MPEERRMAGHENNGTTAPTRTPDDDAGAEFELKLGSIAAVLFAEAMSSVRLFGLGERVGFAWYLAWLLPGALDVYALTMLRFQARVRHGHPLRAKAAREAILALIITVGCNALYEATNLFAAQLPAWAPGALFVLVSALAPFVAGRIIHFQSAVGALRTAAPVAAPATPAAPVAVAPAAPIAPRTPAPAPAHQPPAPATRTTTPTATQPPATHHTTSAPRRTTPEPAKRIITRLDPDAERDRIIADLIHQHDGKVTGTMVGQALGVDRSNGFRALQRYQKAGAQ